MNKPMVAAHEYIKSLDIPAAIESYKEAIIFDQFPLHARIELGKLLINTGKIEDGKFLLEFTNKKFPNKFECVSTLAAAYQRTGQTNKAREFFKQAIKINPQAPSWVFYGAGSFAAYIATFDEPAIAFVPMPKCGSTSIKAHLLKIAQNLTTPNPHPFFENPLFNTSAKKIEDYPNHYKFVVLRDPIDRFLSYYNNNILTQQSLSVRYKKQSIIFGLETQPEINQLIRQWREYCFVFEDFRHHTLPQSAYLGQSLTGFNDVFLLEDIGKLLNKLTQLYQSKEHPTHLMKSEKPISGLYKQLSKKSLETLLEIYQDDYRLAGDLFSSKKFAV